MTKNYFCSLVVVARSKELEMAKLHGPNTFGIEYDDAIAEVARQNGHHTRTADILDTDPAEYGNLSLLHMSPPCTNASNAKNDGGETEQDIKLAEKCAEFVTVCQPETVTLENVYNYRNFQSWAIIEKSLYDNGYGWDYWHLNAADYGVPQNRRRMIAVGRRDGKRPTRPEQTHHETGLPASMFHPAIPRRIGWYEAIEDLLDTLPDSKFAPWQLDRMPAEYKTLLVNGTANDHGSSMTAKHCHEPAFTIVASRHKKMPRAFIVEPVYANIIPGDMPSSTIMASPRTSRVRANVKGRVVALTPRALARLQSFSDTYEFPSKKSLACTIIGNSVPPLLYKNVINSIQE